MWDWLSDSEETKSAKEEEARRNDYLLQIAEEKRAKDLAEHYKKDLNSLFQEERRAEERRAEERKAEERRAEERRYEEKKKAERDHKLIKDAELKRAQEKEMEELKRQLAEAEKPKVATTPPVSASQTLLQQQQREMEEHKRQLAMAQRGPAQPPLSASQTLLQQQQREMEELKRQLAEAEKPKVATTPPVSASQTLLQQQQREMEELKNQLAAAQQQQKARLEAQKAEREAAPTQTPQPTAQSNEPTSSVMTSVGLLSLEDQSSSRSSSVSSTEINVKVEDLLAKVMKNEKDLKANDRKHDKKTTEAKDELSRQFQERLAEMKKEGDLQSNQMAEELKRMREEMMKTHDEKSKKEMERRLKQVEEGHHALRKKFDEKEEILREQQHITKNESHLGFYRSIQSKLQQVILGCNVVATAELKTARVVEIAGEQVPLPGNNLLGDLSATGRSGSGSGSQGGVTSGAMKELDRLTEFVGRKLALMYGEQLDFIGAESAWLLGECAAKEIIAFLWTSKLITPEDVREGGTGYVEAVGKQLIGAVSAIESEEESGKNKEKKIKGKVSGESWKFNTKVMTSTHEEWTSDGIFHRAGILIEKDDGKKMWYSGDPTSPQKYGYRRGTEEEVKREARLKQTRERVSTQVKEAPVLNEGSKAAKKHYDNVAAAAQGNKEEMEIMRRHMQLLQRQMERQDQAIGKLGTPNPTTSSKLPADWTTAEVVAWLDRKGQEKLSALAKDQEWAGMDLFGLYSVRMDSATYQNDCNVFGVTGPLQIRLKGILSLLFEGGGQ